MLNILHHVWILLKYDFAESDFSIDKCPSRYNFQWQDKEDTLANIFHSFCGNITLYADFQWYVEEFDIK